MDFAAGAVADVIAAPPRAAARVQDGDQTGFADHLAAIEPVDAVRPEPETSASQPQDAAPLPNAPAPAPGQQQAQVFLQLVANSAPLASPAPAESDTDETPFAAGEPEGGFAAPPTSAPFAAQPSGSAQTPQTASPELIPAAQAAPAPTLPAIAALPAALAQPHNEVLEDQPLDATTAAALAATPRPTQTMQAEPRSPAPRPGKSDAAKVEAAAGPEAAAPTAPKAHPKASAPGGEGKDLFPVATAEARQAPGQPPQSLLPPALAPSAQASATAIDHAVARAAPAASQVAHEIVRRFSGESTRFELRLDPPELGRVEIRLDVSRDHRVTAVVAADSPHALAELMRGARDLELSLQAAGLELADNGLSFDLRQGNGDAERTAVDEAAAHGNGEAETQHTAAIATARPVGLELWRGVRMDIMV